VFPRGITLLLPLLLAAPVAHAQQVAPPPPRSPSGDSGRANWEQTPASRRAIRGGLQWLASQQLKRSGRWASRPPNWQMSVTALCGLAFLSHGVSPDRGPYAETLRRCLLWILDNQKQDGPFAGLICDSKNVLGPKERPMHGHGFALLLLGQAYGTTHDPALRARIHASLKAGVRITERTISSAGGWYYHPTSRGRHQDEGSVTITQIQALRSARNAGVAVSKSVIDRAVGYIRKSQQRDGGVRYMVKRGFPASPALTAAGIVVFQDSGRYHTKAIEKAYGYLRRHLSVELPEKQKWFFYTHLYASQAMHQRGGAAWKGYFPRIRRELLDMRQGGHWDSDFGPAYGTACALLVLQIPNRYLPIHQR
jgi:hypothetical protein